MNDKNQDIAIAGTDGYSKWTKWIVVGVIAVSVLGAMTYVSFLKLVDNENKLEDNMARDIIMKAALTPAIELSATAYGPLVDMGKSQTYDVILFPHDDEFMSEFVFDFYVKYEKPNGDRYEMTMINSRAFYSITNVTTGVMKVRQCLKDADILGLGEIANVLSSANVLLNATAHLDQIMQCPSEKDGKLVQGEWEHRQYVYCVQTEDTTRDKIISRIAGENLVVDVTYLSETQAFEAKEKYLKPFPKLVNVLNQATGCEKLNLKSSNFDMSLFLEKHNAGNKTTLEGDQRKRELLAWFQSTNKLAKHPARMLQFEGEVVSTDYNFELTQEQLDYIYYVANVIGCTTACYYGNNIAIPIDQLQATVGEANRSFRQRGRQLKDRKRRLVSSESAIITLPRDCIFFTGSGYRQHSKDKSSEDKSQREKYDSGYTPEVKNAEGEDFFQRSKMMIKTDEERYYIGASAAHIGFGGDMGSLCYCKTSKTIFAEIDTYTRAWYDKQNEKDMINFLVWVTQFWDYRKDMKKSTNQTDQEAFQIAKNGWQNFKENPTTYTIENTIVFTHYTSSLTMGAVLANGVEVQPGSSQILFGESSRWITIHSPVLGIDYDDPTEETRALLCSRENIEELVLSVTDYDVSEMGEDAYFELLNTLVDESTDAMLSGGLRLSDIIEACSPHNIENKVDTLLWIRSLIPAYFPTDIKELYERSIAQMGLRVDAAMCGTSDVSYLSPKRLLNEYVQSLGIGGNDTSDGMVPASSCLGLKDLKASQNEEIIWSNDPCDKFVVSSNHNTDLAISRDGIVDGTAIQLSWLECMRLHNDLDSTGDHEDGSSSDDTEEEPNEETYRGRAK